MLSVTALSSYMYCQRKLYLERVLNLYEPPKPALIKGSVRHKTYDLINKNEENIVKSIKEASLHKITEIHKNQFLKFLRTAVLSNKQGLKTFNIDPEQLFLKVAPLIITEAENRSLKIYNVIKEHNVLGEELWEKLTPKMQSEIRIESSKLGLKGIIDQIEVYKEGKVPIELKTGKAPEEGVWPGHRIQLVAYALLLETKHNETIKEGFIAYLDTNQKRHIAINAFMKQEIKDLIIKVNNLLKEKQPPEIEKNQNKCMRCGLRQDCHNKAKISSLIEAL